MWWAPWLTYQWLFKCNWTCRHPGSECVTHSLVKASPCFRQRVCVWSVTREFISCLSSKVWKCHTLLSHVPSPVCRSGCAGWGWMLCLVLRCPEMQRPSTWMQKKLPLCPLMLLFSWLVHAFCHGCHYCDDFSQKWQMFFVFFSLWALNVCMDIECFPVLSWHALFHNLFDSVWKGDAEVGRWLAGAFLPFKSACLNGIFPKV